MKKKFFDFSAISIAEKGQIENLDQEIAILDQQYWDVVAAGAIGDNWYEDQWPTDDWGGDWANNVPGPGTNRFNCDGSTNACANASRCDQASNSNGCTNRIDCNGSTNTGSFCANAGCDNTRNTTCAG